MNDFEDKLNAILSDPGTMAQMANLAQSLNLGSILGGDPPSDENIDTPSPPSTSYGGNPLGSALGDLAGIGELLGQIDPAVITRFLPLIREVTCEGNSDERMALLLALRPFLKPERRSKIERAVRAARLLHVGKQFFVTMGENNV